MIELECKPVKTMKKLILNYRLVFLSILLLSGSLSWAQSRIETYPEITISGTSNIHDWEAISKTGNASFSASFDKHHIVQINFIQVSIPVLSIKSDKGKNMDERMYESLKFDRFPEIKFSLYQVEKIVPINGRGEIIILGFLEIAGRKKLENLHLITQKLTNDTIQISLTKKIMMTDYDIEMPTALFGMIKTGEEVTIHIQFVIQTQER